MKKLHLALFILILAALLIGCGGEAPDNTPPVVTPTVTTPTATTPTVTTPTATTPTVTTPTATTPTVTTPGVTTPVQTTPTVTKHLTHEGDWIVSQASTCTSDGLETRICTVCGASETRAIPSPGHDLLSHDEKSPTCTEEGWLAYQTCTRCDYTTYRPQAPAHIYDEEYGYCTVCHLSTDGKMEIRIFYLTSIGESVASDSPRARTFQIIKHKLGDPTVIFYNEIKKINEPPYDHEIKEYIYVDGIPQGLIVRDFRIKYNASDPSKILFYHDTRYEYDDLGNQTLIAYHDLEGTCLSYIESTYEGSVKTFERAVEGDVIRRESHFSPAGIVYEERLWEADGTFRSHYERVDTDDGWNVYHYDASGMIRTIEKKNAAGTIVRTATYDEFGRLITYTDSPDNGTGNRYTYTFEWVGDSSRIVSVESHEWDNGYLYEEFEYEGDRIVRGTQKDESGAITGYVAYSYSEDGTPLKEVLTDPEGTPVKTLTYGAGGLPAKVEFFGEDNYALLYAYTEEGLPLQVRKESLMGEILYTWKFYYENGVLMTQEELYADGQTAKITQVIPAENGYYHIEELTYTENGRLFSHKQSGALGEFILHHEYTYDEAGARIERIIKDSYGSVTEIEYYENDRLVRKHLYSGVNLSGITLYIYAEDGTLLSEEAQNDSGVPKFYKEFYPDGTVRCEREYLHGLSRNETGYDTDGRELWKTVYTIASERLYSYERTEYVYVGGIKLNRVFERAKYAEDGETLAEKQTSVYEYREDGTLRFETITDKDGQVLGETTYDEQGRAVTHRGTNPSDSNRQRRETYTVYGYTESGDLLELVHEYTLYTRDGSLLLERYSRICTYTDTTMTEALTVAHYDLNGPVSYESTEKTFRISDGFVLSVATKDESGAILTVTEYEYKDIRNNVTKETVKDGDGNILTVTKNAYVWAGIFDIMTSETRDGEGNLLRTVSRKYSRPQVGQVTCLTEWYKDGVRVASLEEVKNSSREDVVYHSIARTYGANGEPVTEYTEIERTFSQSKLLTETEKKADGKVLRERTLLYNSMGLLTSDTELVYEADGETVRTSSTTAHQYTEAGRLAEITVTDQNGIVSYRIAYTLDEYGTDMARTEETYRDESGATLEIVETEWEFGREVYVTHKNGTNAVTKTVECIYDFIGEDDFIGTVETLYREDGSTISVTYRTFEGKILKIQTD